MANSHVPPWDRLQPQDVMSRHRGARQTPPSIWTLGRYQPVIPGVPFIRWAMAPSIREPPDHYDLAFAPARIVILAVKRAYAIALNFTRCPTVFSPPSCSSVTWEETAPVKLPNCGTVRNPDSGTNVRTSKLQGWYFATTPPHLATRFQSLPPYPTHVGSMFSASCSKGSRGLSV